MNGVDVLLPRSIVDPVAWALLHSLWQGALVALLVAVGLRVSRGGAPARRYVFTFAALLVIPLAIAVTAVMSSGYGPPEAISPPAASAPRLESERGAISGATGLLTIPEPPRRYVVDRLEPALPWIFALWVAGVAAVSMVYVSGLRSALRSTRRSAQPADRQWQAQMVEMAARLGLVRPVRLLVSTVVRVPVALGWLEPAIVVPVSVLVGFPPVQVRAVIAHELAHIRRHDYLFNLVQCAVEALIFYHPAVWWISRRVRIEREHCCDDVATSLCGDRFEYARALAALEAARGAVSGLAVAATDGPLLARVRRVLGVSGKPGHPAGSWLAGFTGLLLLGIVVGLAALAGDATAASGGSAPGAVGAGAGSSLAASADPTPVEASDSGSRAEVTGRWWLARVRPDAPLQLEIEARGRAGRQFESVWPEEFERLVEGSAVRFVLRRDAGALTFEGRFDGVSGSGSFTFDAEPEYRSALARLGFGRPGAYDAFKFAVHDVSLESVGELHDVGYAHVGVDGLIYFHVHGVTPAYLACLDEAGYADLSARRVVELMNRDVTPAFVRELAAAGYEDSSIDRMVACRHQGAGGEIVRVLGTSLARFVQFAIGH
jgi:beta-lactamase regulating signal transducer with metallopeptidase domain